NAVNILRQITTNSIYFSHQLLVFFFLLAVIFVFNIYYRNAIVNGTGDFFKILKLADPFFNWFYHEFLHVFRTGAGIDDNNWKLRSMNIRIFSSWHIE